MARVVLPLLLALLALPALVAVAASEAEPAATSQLPAATQPAAALPHITINREQRYVDLEAVVVMREGQWLELLACSPRSREHESVLTVPARPSHVHLALLMLGLEPGQPMSWRYPGEGQDPVVQLPAGPQISIDILYRDKEGKRHELPANQWIIHQKKQTVLDGNVWLFTGSQFIEHEGQRLYRADLGGTVISLVNFGDDLLSRPTAVTNMDDDGMWGCNTELIPDVGTAVTLRLRPKSAEEAAVRKPAEPPAATP
jgi:hypothetical protein